VAAPRPRAVYKPAAPAERRCQWRNTKGSQCKGERGAGSEYCARHGGQDGSETRCNRRDGRGRRCVGDREGGQVFCGPHLRENRARSARTAAKRASDKAQAVVEALLAQRGDENALERAMEEAGRVRETFDRATEAQNEAARVARQACQYEAEAAAEDAVPGTLGKRKAEEIAE